MVSNQLSIYSMLTFIYHIYLVMPASPHFPDVGACEFHSDRKKVGSTDIVTAARSGITEIELWTVDS